MTGAFLESVPKEGEALKIKGSALLALASSREEIVSALKEDVYFKEGIWDLEKVCVLIFTLYIPASLGLGGFVA